MDGQAGPPALGDMLRQIHDDLGALPEGRLEVPVQVVPIQVVFGDRHEDSVPPPPRRPSTERHLLPGGQCQERVPLVAARLVRLGGHEEPHGCGNGLRGQGLSSGVVRTIFMCVAPVRRREPMVTVTFLSSVQGYQEGRVDEVVKRLRADHPEWKVDILSPEASKPVLANYKLQFGPAILVNERMEFVGVPRYRMLVERIAMVGAGRISPRTAQPPTPATSTSAGATKPAAPAKPPAAPETKPSP